MGQVYPAIDDQLAEFINNQRLFFVASAPLNAEGHINLSPKGLGAFRILDPQTVAYLDLTGSGIETMAHVKENARVVIMFCSFEGPPKIVRLYGRGEALEPGDQEFDRLIPQFPQIEGTRSIIRISLDRIADSCGFGVPLFEYKGDRQQLIKFAEQLGPEKMNTLRIQRNSRSIDGLPGIKTPAQTG